MLIGMESVSMIPIVVFAPMYLLANSSRVNATRGSHCDVVTVKRTRARNPMYVISINL